MFLSLRLAALTTVLFISHVYGLVIPLDKRFVPFFLFLVSWQPLIGRWIEIPGINFVTVMLNSVIVNTETPPSLVLMTRSPPVETFLLVRIILFFSLVNIFSQWNNYSWQDTRGGCADSTNDGGEVVASAGSHVRSKTFFLTFLFFIHSWGCVYFLGIGKTFTSATLVSLSFIIMVLYERTNSSNLFLLSYYSLRKFSIISQIHWAKNLDYTALFNNSLSSMVEKS